MKNIKKETKDYRVLLAALVCMASLGMMGFALSRQGVQNEMVEFTPPPFESAAVAGVPAVSDIPGWQELNAQLYKVGICGRIIPDNGRADVWLTNPAENTVWLKVRVLDEKGKILGETGLLKPGEYVQSVRLADVPKAGTAIVLKIMAYQPETYYSEGAVSLNTTIRKE